MTPLRLGLNIDHVATLRNARGGTHPDPVAAAAVALAAGADGITFHLREDRRHIRDDDVRRLKAELNAPLNLEMAATEEMVRTACAFRPEACCLVPERRLEITTEGGLDAAGLAPTLRPIVAALREAGITVSLFIDPEPRQIEAAASLGAPVVELHTGAYASGRAGEVERLAAAAKAARAAGLVCHAGHGLTYGNVVPVAALVEISELNIGHYLIGQAVFDGLGAVVREMKRLMTAARLCGTESPR